MRTDQFAPGTITQTDFAFTGQRNVASLKLMDYHARFYDGALGRFIQPDTIIPGAASPQTWNRYSYVYNDPIGLLDPSGQSGTCDDTASGYSCGQRLKKQAIMDQQGVEEKAWEDRMWDKWERGRFRYHSYGTSMAPPYKGAAGSGVIWTHDYTIIDVVCSGYMHCTRDDMIYYLSLFDYPGQNPSSPVENTRFYSVAPFGEAAVNSDAYNKGLIQIFISPDKMTITNIAQPSHFFCCGRVVRSLSQDVSGAWSVTTRGYGTNPDAGNAILNQYAGPGAFLEVDNKMKGYVFDKYLPGAAEQTPAQLIP